MPTRPFVTRVCRNGNSLTVVIPHVVCVRKNIKKGDSFGIAVVGNSIVYTKIDDNKSIEIEGAAAADAVQRLKFDDEQKAIA